MQRFITALVLGSCISCSVIVAQDVSPLNEDEQQAMNSIQERVVKSSLIFLASDALEGRGTPSQGFDIACEYVAARFQAAGLKGLGKNESYFQTTTVNTVQVPAGGSMNSASGTSPQVFATLNGGSSDLQFSGELPVVELQSDLTDVTFDGPVVVSFSGEGSLFRQLGTLGRFANKIARQGATGIVLRCSQDSDLVGYAATAREPKIENRRVNIGLPVLLIDKETEISGSYTVRIPQQIVGKTEVRNCIGILEGSDPDLKQEAIILTAHLDHIGVGGGNAQDRINNGADDNASGSTAIMSLADAYASLATPPKRTVIFMTFWGEERGMLGSRHYCDNPLWPLEKTVANINLEMIGRPEAGARSKCWMTGWDQSDLGRLMAPYSKRAGVELFNHPQFSDRLYGASDNISFVRRGVVAHSFSAGSLHGDYHQVTDEWEKLDTEHMTSVIRGIFAATLPLANGEITPVKTGSR